MNRWSNCVGQVSDLGDLLLVAAAVGGAQEFAEVLDLVVERNSRINVATYHQVLTELLFRVPTPVAMVRLALNLTIRKPDDIVPLLPDGLGDGPSEAELFRGCCPRGEVADGSGSIESACGLLQGVVIEDLLGRVELPDFCCWLCGLLFPLHSNTSLGCLGGADAEASNVGKTPVLSG